MNIVDRIHNEFILEAENSPMLMTDLAAMEKYISESYAGRSLIELLQNADDAGATRFQINKIAPNVYLVANNGRVFSEEDLYALCRSGSSTKRRREGTIGFRGIGFKSVVNYSNVVHLVSGSIQTSFSKSKTLQELNSINQVPLIRIPHIFSGDVYIDAIKTALDEGYNTVFVFEAINDSLEQEIKSFSISCMLFLRNLTQILYNSNDKRAWRTSLSNHDEISKVITCYDETDISSWVVFSDNTRFPCDIAFLYDNKAIPARSNDAVVHSFMPTFDRLSIPIKINGDFTTDPSRTRITADDDSVSALENCSSLLCNIIKSIIQCQEDRYGIVNVVSQGSVDPLSQIKGKTVSDLFIEIFYRDLLEMMKILANGKDIYYQQPGITDSDFKTIINRINAFGINNELDRKIPGIISLAEKIGIKPIPLKKTLEIMAEVECDESTRIQILSDVVKESRLGVNPDMIDSVKNALIINYDTGIKRIADQDCNDVMDESFHGAIVERVGIQSNVDWFSKQLNIQVPVQNMKNTSSKKQLSKVNHSTYCVVHNVSKWRSVEENFVPFVESLPNVKTAIDVAAKNLGYDIDVELLSGDHEYYEVKSVAYIGDSFSMTNNEFATAIQYKEKYKLAVIHQSSEKYEVCIISDPANNLVLNKRVTRWEWYCNNYSGDSYQANIV